MNTFSKKMVVRLIAVAVAVMVLVGAGSFVAYRVYVVRDDSQIVRQLGSWLPAAKAGEHTITYGDFLKTRDTLKIYLSSDAAKQGGFSQPLTPDVEKQALDRLVRDQLTMDLAAQRNVTVTDADVQGSFAVMVNTNSSTVPDVSKFLQQNYNWTPEDFQKNVIRPAIYEERVSATFSTSTAEQYALMEGFMSKRMTDPDVHIYLKFDK